MKRIVAASLVLVAFVAVAAGCGSKREATAAPTPQPVELVLDFFPNADHAGIYAAQADGEFRREGLDSIDDLFQAGQVARQGVRRGFDYE